MKTAQDTGLKWSRTIDKIVEILENSEGRLSDGYAYYAEGDDEVDETLRDIATQILKTIKWR